MELFHWFVSCDMEKFLPECKAQVVTNSDNLEIWHILGLSIWMSKSEVGLTWFVMIVRFGNDEYKHHRVYIHYKTSSIFDMLLFILL